MGPAPGASAVGRWSRLGPAPSNPRRGAGGPNLRSYVPYGWSGLFPASGRSAPGARLPGGVPISPEKWGERGPGASPLDPRFLWPLVPTRWFLGSLSLIRSRGYFLRYAKTDLGRIFEKKYSGKHFCERKFPNQGTYMGAVIVPQPPRCATQRQSRTSEQRVALTPGGGGASPRDSLRPGPGGGSTSQGPPCGGPNRTTCRYARNAPPQ